MKKFINIYIILLVFFTILNKRIHIKCKQEKVVNGLNNRFIINRGNPTYNKKYLKIVNKYIHKNPRKYKGKLCFKNNKSCKFKRKKKIFFIETKVDKIKRHKLLYKNVKRNNDLFWGDKISRNKLKIWKLFYSNKNKNSSGIWRIYSNVFDTNKEDNILCKEVNNPYIVGSKFLLKFRRCLMDDNMVNFIWICKNYFLEKKIFFLTIFTMLNSGIISIIVPIYDNILFNNLTNKIFDNFMFNLFNCVIIRIISLGLCILRNWIFMRVSCYSLKRVKNILFEIYINKNYEYFDKVDHNSVINRLTLEAYDFSNIIAYYINPFIRNLFSIILNFSYLFYLNQNLTKTIFIFFCISSVLTIISYKLKRKSLAHINKEKNKNANISLESFKNINIIKLFSTEFHEYNKYSMSLNNILNRQKKKEQFNLLHMLVSKLFVTITYVFILLKGSSLISQNKLDNKTFTSLFFYINNIYSCIDILDYYIEIRDIIDQNNGIIKLLKENLQGEGNKNVGNETRIIEKSKLENIMEKKNEKNNMSIYRDKNNDVVLEFKGVYFKYPTNINNNNYVLKNINIKINKGTNNVILGKSGEGKSTLLKLILNLYKSSKGKIYLYNKLLNNYSSREIFDKITYVEQNSKLLKKTIRENITYGIKDNTNFDMLDLVNISKCCTSHEFISRLRKRYETIISNTSELMTASQKQKICIARALIHFPKILLLDESTSAMESKNERIIFENIQKNELFKNLTIIRITHKRANLDLANNVFVLKDGYLKKQKHV
ncbi:ABC transporter B family member 3, putative [Plasmodium berghei]|uniref:ABC transporter B family member 3, putative n=2 Tax=Plasmodium berghei TaxID=5821 RepID=A0A509AJA0_PLABA|nr:ABC transporter B family member 3, putative [Plasmodium berghei ANKA]CXI39662.1 ABC transporter B family member 3, putative [Plasmodium berghei]SCM21735.1 ABC transporter B family member 3, putative [Plasmodium berghei]SCN24992.1 ABC transporter B family member 3, putative [Plasmodium berghei]SCO60052.1 ABC transporter B family member 3, putative [Plasmodium berghei]SCO61517.1 ABC transporter B family member 3, putative [Plasmodium berghei]|eukprot:XP_034421386.1 ABC transporter B family member 3, putative [Plasmodium berghei ANKA]